ncbi:HTH-type transcriptional regulator Xre [Blautia producta]|uniref:HTH-type transcriptional regulator Xre n=1 Tax=Blautia producta TaxID=33035 RepID=A0A4P6LSP4_9FIRM|nr:helix-turn-helix transcriptional regulator [Blautia producta]QBE95264.1 HTH-type transcriptional regulator Xre [Blautia producta]
MIYERIKELSKTKGISINQLEKKLGLSKGSLCRIDTNRPSVDKLQRIADYFGVTIEYLMTGHYEDEDHSPYYLNDETRAIAQAAFENPDMRSLFDMSRKMSPDRLKAHLEFMKKLQESEEGNGLD